MSISKMIFILMITVALIGPAPAREAVSAPTCVYMVTQLTDNTVTDWSPEISGDYIAWVGSGGADPGPDGGNDWEIFLYDGTTLLRLTDNAVEDTHPDISGNKVVWQGRGGSDGGNDWEVFLYDGTQVIQLTANTGQDVSPKISGDKVVWMDQGGPGQIFFYDGTQVIPLSGGDFPRIDGDKIVWNSRGDVVYEYDGTQIIKLSADGARAWYPEISGDKVVWVGYDSNDDEIFLYDGTQIIQLSDNTMNDYYPQISGDKVTWHGWDGTDYEIFLYDGTQTIQLTDNTTRDWYPKISGDWVTWYGYGGSDGGKDYEVFLYDGTQVIQLTTNTTEDSIPRVSGDRVVWHGWDGSDYEVYLYSCVPLVDLAVTKTESIDPVEAGSGLGNLTYVVTVTNTGVTNTATGVALDEVLTLPAGVTVDSITPSAGTFADPVWTVGTLAPGASATLTVVLTVDETAVAGTDVISDTATITAFDQIDQNPANDSATEATSITVPEVPEEPDEPDEPEEPEIPVIPAASAPLLNGSGALQPGGLGLPGEQVTWIVTMAAPPDGALSNVTITDMFPPELRVDGVTTTAGTAAINGQMVTVTTPSLSAGVPLEMRATTTILRSPSVPYIENTAILRADGGVYLTATAQIAVVQSLPGTGYPPAAGR
jgi:beta propeller repeat protein